VKHFLRKRVAFDTANVANGLSMGWLPAGAVITAVEALVTEAFNAGTTNVVKVGTRADDDAYLAAADLNETATGLTRYVGKAARMAADTEVVVAFTQTGAAATAGEAEVIVEFVPDTDD
jgi:hypothetical protein